MKDTGYESRDTKHPESRIQKFGSRFSRQFRPARLGRVERLRLFLPIRFFSACTGCATVSGLFTSCVVYLAD